ncbi:MAG: hypothetical protein ACI4O6_07955 [Dysosmobacter sp.]
MTVTEGIASSLEITVIPLLWQIWDKVKAQDKYFCIIIALLAALLLVTIILGVVIIRRQKRIEKMLKELTEARNEEEGS